MSESATTKAIRSLQEQLKNEEIAHTATRNQLQSEIQRVWRLVPVNLVVLMHEMPPLKRLLLLVGEALGLADPLRGAPVEDTMRTQFVSVGQNASTSATEAGVFAHNRDRANLIEIERRLRYVTEELGRLLKARETEYDPPDGKCLECGGLLYQTDKGPRRSYCSATCRKRASRVVTGNQSTESLASR